MDYMSYIWIGIFVVSLVVEIAVPALVSLWFCGGAVISLLLSVFLGNSLIWLQVLVFIISSVACFLLLRPILLKNRKEKTDTNVDSLIGKIGTVQDDIIKYNLGTVKINGLVWNAELDEDDHETIIKDSLVQIIKVKGNKLIVKKYGNKEEITNDI